MVQLVTPFAIPPALGLIQNFWHYLITGSTRAVHCALCFPCPVFQFRLLGAACAIKGRSSAADWTAGGTGIDQTVRVVGQG